MKAIISAALGACLAFSIAPGAQAQEYPTRTITLVVGFAAGGAVDIVARTIGAQLQEQTG